MKRYPIILHNELARLERLYSYDILNMSPEARFDDLNELAASILDLPISLITLMDADRQVYISRIGTEAQDALRETSFCQFCVIQEDLLEIKDAAIDDRVAQNPLVVKAPHVRYYIGAPLVDNDGFVLGTICGYDSRPRELSEIQRDALSKIASSIIQLIQLRKIESEANLTQKNDIIVPKDQFLSDLSHKLRTPLSSIVGFNKLVRSSDLSDQQRSYAEMVGNAAEQLLTTVNQALNLGKLSTQSNSTKIPSLNGTRVLLAEDNRHLQLLCKTLIERNNGVVFVVSNGKEAIDFLAREVVDVVILDIYMPIMTGIQAARHIREEMELSYPIIGCSANLIDAEFSPEERKYLDTFMMKPFPEFDLIKAISRLRESATDPAKDNFRQILDQLRITEGDALIDEFQRIFKKRIPQDILDLEKGRDEKNFRAIQEKAHYLSTTLLTLKFNQGLALSAELEMAVGKRDNTSALALTNQFIEYLNGALNAL